jgi:hypothetical protein
MGMRLDAFCGEEMLIGNTRFSRRHMGALSSASNSILLHCFLVATPIFAYFLYVHFYGVDVLFWDDWEIIPLVERARRAGLSVASLWAQHNESRMLVANAVMLALASLTHLNIKAEMYLGAVLLAASFVVVCLLYFRSGGRSCLVVLPVACLFFSLVQYENTLWGFQVAWYIVLLCLLLTILLLDCMARNQSVPQVAFLILAMLAAMMGSFSSFQGLLVWPCGLLFIATTMEDRKGFGAVWAISGIFVWVVYFLGFRLRDAGIPSILSFGRHPITSIAYFFVSLGSVVMLPHSDGMLAVLGVVGVLIFTIGLYVVRVWLTDPAARRKIAAPCVLIIFGLSFYTSLMIGRSGFGILQATSSRYTTYGLLTLSACYLALTQIMSMDAARGEVGPSLRARGYWAVCVLLVFLQVLSSAWGGLVEGQRMRQLRCRAAEVLLNYRLAADDVLARYLYPDPGMLRVRARIAEELRLSVFSEAEGGGLGRVRRADLACAAVRTMAGFSGPLDEHPMRRRGRGKQWMAGYREQISLFSLPEYDPDLDTAGFLAKALRQIREGVAASRHQSEMIDAARRSPWSTQRESQETQHSISPLRVSYAAS